MLDYPGHHAELHDDLRRSIHNGDQMVHEIPSIYLPAPKVELDQDKVIRNDEIPWDGGDHRQEDYQADEHC